MGKAIIAATVLALGAGTAVYAAHRRAAQGAIVLDSGETGAGLMVSVAFPRQPPCSPA